MKSKDCKLFWAKVHRLKKRLSDKDAIDKVKNKKRYEKQERNYQERKYKTW